MNAAYRSLYALVSIVLMAASLGHVALKQLDQNNYSSIIKFCSMASTFCMIVNVGKVKPRSARDDRK
jgi:hypothetical protein